MCETSVRTDAYGGAIALGAPSLFASWGFDLLRDAAALVQPPVEIRMLDRTDQIDPQEPRLQTLYLANFPSASVLSAIESGQMPVVSFFDQAPDIVAYIRSCSGVSFVEALRAATAAAVANRVLLGAGSSLVIGRAENGPASDMVDRILRHLRIGLPAAADRTLKHKYCGADRSEDTLEQRLREIGGYRAPGDWADVLSAKEAAIAESVLPPLMQTTQQEQRAPIKWPNDVFLSGDRPNERAPLVADVAGGARYLFYGPYFHLPPGTYRVRLVAGFSQAAVGAPFTAEVYAATTLLAKARFEPRFHGILQGEFLVIHKRPQDTVEVRFHSDESAFEGQVGLAWVEFQYLGNADAPPYPTR